MTRQAYGNIEPELLVTIFLAANAVASACEPIILSRLGLRRTVLFGALLLMIGSIIKSGGMPPIIMSDLEQGEEWRVYIGFFLVGLSQPLYQCTPALLSASWFPEAERTLATGVALNANQLGIGFAFVFGTLLVSKSADIPSYFGFLSMISTIAFLGTLIQFEDAPPTPPSDTARVMRGDLDMKLPSVQSVFDTIVNFSNNGGDATSLDAVQQSKSSPPTRRSPSSAPTSLGSSGTRRRHVNSNEFAPAPSPANWEEPVQPRSQTYAASPSNARLAPGEESQQLHGAESVRQQEAGTPMNPYAQQQMYGVYQYAPGIAPVEGTIPGYNVVQSEQYQQYAPVGYSVVPQHRPPHEYSIPVHPYAQPGPIVAWDPRYQQYVYLPYNPRLVHPGHASLAHHDQSYQHPIVPYYARDYEAPEDVLPPSDAIDEGVEPVLTLTPHHLDIHIRDDQVILSIKACLARPGFIHALVCFAVSGIVINTLSTFMDYLVRLNGAGREYTGIVGGTFQVVIMISSLIIGKICDKTRAYYSIAIGMLVLGAFGLAECGVSLDANQGADLRWSLIIVALLVGPLQPVSTELGVDVAYPLSENTVLVIQQLFSNLLSAMFIPAFKAMKGIGLSNEYGTQERPEYTFSFYLLIVLHAIATVFFATFNGRYLRYEHELEKKAIEERRKAAAQATAFNRADGQKVVNTPANERTPLVAST